MKNTLFVIAASLALLIGAQAHAADASAQTPATGAKFDVDLHASTLGMGIGLSLPVTDDIGARLSLNKYTTSFNSTSDSIRYDGSINLESIAALADWHLFSGTTHLTAGMVYNNNNISMTGTPTGASSYTINGTTYSLSSLTTDIAFNKFVPYLGFGWSGRPSQKGFSFKSDFGVMFQGAPKATITASGTGTSVPGFSDNVAASESKLNSDLSNFTLWPVISVGMGYAF